MLRIALTGKVYLLVTLVSLFSLFASFLSPLIFILSGAHPLLWQLEILNTFILYAYYFICLLACIGGVLLFKQPQNRYVLMGLIINITIVLFVIGAQHVQQIALTRDAIPASQIIPAGPQIK